MKPEEVAREIAPAPAPEQTVLDQIRQTYTDDRHQVWEYPKYKGGAYWQKAHPLTGPVRVMYGPGKLGKAARSIAPLVTLAMLAPMAMRASLGPAVFVLAIFLVAINRRASKCS